MKHTLFLIFSFSYFLFFLTSCGGRTQRSDRPDTIPMVPCPEFVAEMLWRLSRHNVKWGRECLEQQLGKLVATAS